MHLLQIICAFVAVLFGFALLVAVLVALGTLTRRALHQRNADVLRVSRLGGLLLASAFLGFQRIVHPHVRHAIVQEVAEDDDTGDGEPGVRPSQLRRIRQGEEVEHLELVRGAQERILEAGLPDPLASRLREGR